jgi:hypothetical protein
MASKRPGFGSDDRRRGETAMQGQRIILGTMVVLVAAATALGTGRGASADAREGDHGSKDNFKSYCKTLEGTFSEDGLGNTKCTYKGGSYTECDANGNDCRYISEPKRAEPGDPLDPYDGGDGQVADDPGGSPSPAPVADSPTPSSAQPIVAAPDDNHDRDTGKHKGKKGKKGGKRHR